MPEEPPKIEGGNENFPVPPINAGESFWPEEEVRNILKSPKNEHRKNLENFKEKFAFQNERLANFYEEMVSNIAKNPDDHHKNFNRIKSLSTDLGLSPAQAKIAVDAFKNYVRRHNEVSAIRKKYQDDAELYRGIFKQYPRGKVEIKEGPMSLYFKCYDVEDYALINSGAFVQDRKLTAHDIESAKHSMGRATSAPGLESSILAENTSLIRTNYKNDPRYGDDPNLETFIDIESESTRAHEEQHAIKKLFQETMFRKGAFGKILSATNEKEMESAIIKTLRYDREYFAESRAKDEILAYFTEKVPASVIYENLTQSKADGGIYDYWEEHKKANYNAFHPEWKKMLEDKKIRPMIDKAEKKVFIDEYHKIISSGIRSFRLLRGGGYNDEQIIGLLTNEPLSRWPKFVSRLAEGRRIAKEKK